MNYSVVLDNGDLAVLHIEAKAGRGDSLVLSEDFKEHAEAELQLMEGHGYEYALDESLHLRAREKSVIQASQINKGQGWILPGNYVGTLPLEIVDKEERVVGSFSVEVRSYKTEYREDYQSMLEYITDKSTALILQYTSPVTQNLTVNFDADSETLYQRFAFVQSLLESREFQESVNRIVTMPVTEWRSEIVEKDIRRARKLSAKAVRHIATGKNRMPLPADHPLTLHNKLTSVPTRIPVTERYETVDTAENRFVQFALTGFMSFCAEIASRLKEKSYAKKQAELLVEKLDEWLGHSMFKEVSQPTIIPLNSPVLQRKEGYREVLKAWLMFDLASKLVWKGGEDVYSAGKRDVAQLYEYWVFFRLLDIFSQKFSIKKKHFKRLLTSPDNELSINLISGTHTALKGVYDSGKRKMNIKYSFNRSFGGKKEYPNAGSWTINMRPDYTLSVWPLELTEKQAEKEELIVHVHFDAKYKIDRITELFKANSEDEEDVEKSVGSFKRDDLLKMHAYKDAIRRTGGAYVLYPGDKDMRMTGFHELIPGLGAFPLRPTSDDGSGPLIQFIDEVIEHLDNRATQRERIAYRNFEIHKDSSSNELNELLPEAYGDKRSELPTDTFVLVGYYRDKEQLNWIESKLLYNARTGKRGDFDLGPKETGAKYILLHGSGELKTSRLMRIVGHADEKTGPRIFSKLKMERLKYPLSENSAEYYAVFKLDKNVPKEFEEHTWDVRKLDGYKPGIGSAFPFAVSLFELMKTKVH